MDGNSLASEHANQPGLLLSYYDISLHAISKDPSSFPEECIYMLLDGARGADPGAHSEIGECVVLWVFGRLLHLTLV